jgi:hypothetical protein
MNDEIHKYAVTKKSKASLFLSSLDKKRLIKFGIATAATVIGVGLTVTSFGLAAYDMAMFYAIASTTAGLLARRNLKRINKQPETDQIKK